MEEMSFMQRVLRSTKEDGTFVYSHLERIVYLSVKPIGVKDGIGMNFWLPAFRNDNEPVVNEFLD
jgi:hypothetical protein